MCRIKQSLDRKPRKLQLLYVNPIYRDLPTRFGFREAYHTCEMTYLEAVIYVSEKPENLNRQLRPCGKPISASPSSWLSCHTSGYRYGKFFRPARW